MNISRGALRLASGPSRVAGSAGNTGNRGRMSSLLGLPTQLQLLAIEEPAEFVLRRRATRQSGLLRARICVRSCPARLTSGPGGRAEDVSHVRRLGGGCDIRLGPARVRPRFPKLA